MGLPGAIRRVANRKVGFGQASRTTHCTSPYQLNYKTVSYIQLDVVDANRLCLTNDMVNLSLPHPSDLDGSKLQSKPGFTAAST